MTDIRKAAEKEIARMEKVFAKLSTCDGKMCLEFYDFAKRYFEDGKWFLKKGKYLEAFEAAVIAWAYVDAGIKLCYFLLPKELKENFTA